jgi:hypothetical protein
VNAPRGSSSVVSTPVVSSSGRDSVRAMCGPYSRVKR